MNISSLGDAHVKRIKGTAMGGTLSSVKAELIVSAGEGQWLSDVASQKAFGFVKEGQTHDQVAAGLRYADDSIFLSKALCKGCLQEWAEKHYPFPMKYSNEEEGHEATFCDLAVSAQPMPTGEWNAKLRRHDKNEKWLRGMELEPGRARFEPALGRRMRPQIRSWMIGSFHLDRSRCRGFTNAQTIDMLQCGAVRMVTELVFLGHSCSDIESAARSLRDERLRWAREAAIEWCHRVAKSAAAEDPDELCHMVDQYHLRRGIL